VDKHELSKVEFEIIEKALKALLQSNLDPVCTENPIRKHCHIRTDASTPRPWLLRLALFPTRSRRLQK
jgi:hypothetical protein